MIEFFKSIGVSHHGYFIYNYFDPQISIVTVQPKVSKIENEFEPQFRISVSSKYIKFHIRGEEVIYWESQNVKFPTKKND